MSIYVYIHIEGYVGTLPDKWTVEWRLGVYRLKGLYHFGHPCCRRPGRTIADVVSWVVVAMVSVATVAVALVAVSLVSETTRRRQ